MGILGTQSVRDTEDSGRRDEQTLPDYFGVQAGRDNIFP